MARAMEMSESSAREYTEKMRGRHGRMTGKAVRSRLLDEYVAVTGFERKYAIKVLGGKLRIPVSSAQVVGDPDCAQPCCRPMPAALLRGSTS